MKSVGIDIGSYSIKVVEVDTASKGYAITNYHEHILSSSPAQDQELEIIEYIQNLAKVYDLTQTTITVGIRQERISVRNKIFPFRERQKILKSLAFELEDDVPFATDAAIFDAKVIRHIGTQAEVLACACPKVYVAQTRAQVADAGLPPTILSGEGLALSNLFEAWDAPPPQVPQPSEDLATENETPPPKDVNALLYIGHTRTILAYFEGRTLIGVRSILWGGQVIGEAIAQKYDLPVEAALREFQNKGFILTSKEGATFDQIAFSDTISKCVDELVRETQLSFLEVQSELNCRIRTVSLLGGVSRLQNLGAYLTQQFEIPVNKTSAYRQFNAPKFEVTEHIQAVSGVALSLAIEGIKRPRNPALNFLRGEFAEQSQFAKRLWEYWGHTAIVALVALSVFVGYGIARESFAKSAADQSHILMRDQAMNVAGLSRTQVTISGVSRWIRDQERRAQEMHRLEALSEMNSAMAILNSVNSALPARQQMGLEIKNFTVRDNEVRIEGWAKGSVQAIQQALGKIAQGGKVEAGTSRIAAPSGARSFAMTFNVDRNIRTEGL